MKKRSKRERNPDLLAEYDFSGGVRGKYAERYRQGTNIVVLDPDVARVFRTPKSVNDALRLLSTVIRQFRGKKSA
jgi:hypothetical protein